MLSRSILLCFMMYYAISGTAQEQLGIQMSNYAGINAVNLNPSAHLSSPFPYDVNIFGLAEHFMSNYAYLENTSMLELLGQGRSLSIYSAPSQEENGPPGPDDQVLDFYDDGRNRYGFNVTQVMGPSFFAAIDERHVVGLVTRFRTIGNGNSVPEALSFYTWRDRPLDESFEVDPFQGAFLSAMELGLNYLYRQELPNGWLGLGVTAKYIFGLESGFLHSPDHITMLKPSPEELSSEAFTMDFGLTTSALNSSGYQPTLNGGGFGVDLGVTYTLDNEEGTGYAWKLGASLLDLGWVGFRNNSERHHINTANTQTITEEVYVDLDGPEDLTRSISLLSEQLYGDAEATLEGDSYSMMLPMALSLQADRYLDRDFYLSGLLVLPASVGRSAPRRSALVAVTPRLEKRWWGVAMPVLLEHWRDLRVGAAFRVGPLFLGTDDLGSFFPSHRLDSVDFYLALKFNPFDRNADRMGRKRRGQRLQCYTF